MTSFCNFFAKICINLGLNSHIDFLSSHIKCFVFHSFNVFFLQNYKITNVKSKYTFSLCTIPPNLLIYLIYFCFFTLPSLFLSVPKLHWLWSPTQGILTAFPCKIFLFLSWNCTLCGLCFYSYLAVDIISQISLLTTSSPKIIVIKKV